MCVHKYTCIWYHFVYIFTADFHRKDEFMRKYMTKNLGDPLLIFSYVDLGFLDFKMGKIMWLIAAK